MMGGEFSESGEPSNTWAPVIYIYFQSDRKIYVACFSFCKPLFPESLVNLELVKTCENNEREKILFHKMGAAIEARKKYLCRLWKCESVEVWKCGSVEA